MFFQKTLFKILYTAMLLGSFAGAGLSSPAALADNMAIGQQGQGMMPAQGNLSQPNNMQSNPAPMNKAAAGMNPSNAAPAVNPNAAMSVPQTPIAVPPASELTASPNVNSMMPSSGQSSSSYNSSTLGPAVTPEVQQERIQALRDKLQHLTPEQRTQLEDSINQLPPNLQQQVRDQMKQLDSSNINAAINQNNPGSPAMVGNNGASANMPNQQSGSTQQSPSAMGMPQTAAAPQQP